MFENIRNVTTRLSMDPLRPNLGGHITPCPRHVPHDSVAMATAVAQQRRINDALNILQLWTSGGRTREPILIKFGTQQQVMTAMTVTWLNIKIFKIQNGGKYLQCHNSPTNGLTGTQLLWSHPIGSPTGPPRCGCHGNGCCPATTHCIFSNYGRLETERVIQFWWNLVSKRKLGPQWQSRDQILFFFNSKWRTASMLENIPNVITPLPMDRLRPKLGDHSTSRPRHVPHDSVAMATAVA